MYTEAVQRVYRGGSERRGGTSRHGALKMKALAQRKGRHSCVW
jgi:hypothetical protein